MNYLGVSLCPKTTIQILVAVLFLFFLLALPGKADDNEEMSMRWREWVSNPACFDKAVLPGEVVQMEGMGGVFMFVKKFNIKEARQTIREVARCRKAEGWTFPDWAIFWFDLRKAAGYHSDKMDTVPDWSDHWVAEYRDKTKVLTLKPADPDNRRIKIK